MTRILAFAGSTRRESFNKRLVWAGARKLIDRDTDVQVIDLQDVPLPLYDGDLEAADGLPENVIALKQQFLAHDGFLIASPEYNSSLTAVLKNLIDWVSRPHGDEPPLAAFRGKTAGLLSASPGALGGLRGLVHLRAILGNIGVHVIPSQLAVSKAHDAFDEDGNLRDEGTDKRLTACIDELVETTKRLRAE